MNDISRRSVLRTAGAAVAVGVAGCTGDGGGDGGDGDGGNGGGGGGTPTVAGSEYPAIDEWLTETEVGGAAGNYGGNLVDRTGRETVTVDVGASGNDGSFAFGPPGVVVSTGTTVEFSWTGQGNPHNVVAAPEKQLGESDYTFRSGDPTGGSGVKFRQTMDQSGVALYHCEPHLSLGMKGGIAVE